jgi:hypothetical protein
MANYDGSRFLGKLIELDGNIFRRCTFEDCSLKFGATAPTELSGCSFNRCRLVADGSAELTIAYLKAFHRGLGDWGRAAVEALFDSIRGQAPAAPAWSAELEAFGASAEGRQIVRGFKRLSAAQRAQIAALIEQAAGKGPETARRGQLAAPGGNDGASAGQRQPTLTPFRPAAAR